MKTFIIFFLILSSTLCAQILQWDPLFATVDDTITIVYDATQGSAGLVGESTIYVHTGVLTTDSQQSSDWEYVKTKWGQNTLDTKLTPLGNDRWRMRFHIKSYYGLPDTVKVTHLAFVFRNADGEKTGKTAEQGDIFLPLSNDGAQVRLLSPAKRPTFLNVGDSLNILFIASSMKELKLFLDDEFVFGTSSDTLRYSKIIENPQKQRVRIDAVDSTNAVFTTQFYYIANAPLITAPLPAGVEYGINYISNTEVVLALHAPNKKFAYLIGDWNEWEADPDYYLNRTPNGATYWLRLENLTPGQIYRYQYWVDDQVKIADPYTELVLDPDHDKYISESTFPNLPPYPSEKTAGRVSTLQTAQVPFTWTANYERPAKENLVIYELLVRDFIEAHNYTTLIDTLDYFSRLGVNAIELMPVSEFEGNLSWGYNQSYNFALDKYYGRKIDLQRFIDEAHKRGIAVILDLVLNHAFGQSPMVELYEGELQKSPWFNETSPNPVYYWGVDFNHERKATQDYIDRVASYWLQEYNVDGFRYDFTKGFTNKGGDGWAYDNSRIAILKRMADHVWSVEPGAFIILEHLAENSEEKELAEYGMMLWGNTNYNYNEATMGYHDGGKSDFSWGVYTKRGWNQPNLITYMESHDEERLMYKNLQYGNSFGGYSIKHKATALARMEMAAAFFFTFPGPKMMWQFGEVGYDYSIDYNDRVGEKPIRWDYFDEANRQKLFRVFSALIKLKQKHKVFSTTDFDYSFTNAFKGMRLHDDSMSVVIVGNFDVKQLQQQITFQHSGTWYDYFSGEPLHLDAAQETITLDAGEYHIYTDLPLETPKTGVDAPDVSLPISFDLAQNYPNPFNPQTTIQFSVQNDGHAEVTIYNISGQKIKTLWDETTKAGQYTATWNGLDENGSRVSSGLYFYKLATENQSITKKMILAR